MLEYFLENSTFFALEKFEKPPQKVAYLWQLGVFFLCSADCPKQPRTSSPFYKLFYPTISGRISVPNSRIHTKNIQKRRRIYHHVIDITFKIVSHFWVFFVEKKMLTGHHNPLLIRNHSWIPTVYMAKIFWKTSLKTRK